MSTRPVILVTGGAGYIGSKLIRDLAIDPRFAGMTVRIYDSLRHKYLDALMDLPTEGHYEFIEGDILDRLNLHRAMQDVVAVIHLAAIVTTPFSFDHPEWTKQVNHWGTASVVDSALSAGVVRMIHVSSASVYGPGDVFKETDACGPIGPYAVSKLHAEGEVLQGQARGLKPTIVRLGTTFGNAPSMRFDAIANKLAYLVGVGRPMVIHGSGRQIRPLIHISEASAVLRFCLAEAKTENEVLNAVTLNPTADEIAKTLQQLVPEATIRYTDQDILTEISYAVDSSKLMGMGFASRIGLKEGLKDVLARWQGFTHPD